MGSEVRVALAERRLDGSVVDGLVVSVEGVSGKYVSRKVKRGRMM